MSQEVLAHLPLFPESQSCNSLPAMRSQPAAVTVPTAPVVLPTCHRDTIPEQTNAVARNSAPLPCTSDRKHGHMKQLFSTQTQIKSLSRMARCACMTMRHKQPCTSVSQDDNYQTSQECPSKKHHTLDLSHSLAKKKTVRQKKKTVRLSTKNTTLRSMSCRPWPA